MSEGTPDPGADPGTDRPHPAVHGRLVRPAASLADPAFTGRAGPGLPGRHLPGAGRRAFGGLVHPRRRVGQADHRQSPHGVQPVRDPRAPGTVAVGVVLERQRLRGQPASPTTRSCTTPGTTCWPTICANFGLSGAANGGIASSGIFEARDVTGSLAYARSRRDTRAMTIGLFSRCLGCSSTFAAMTQFPAAFDGVRCLVGPQPVTMKTIVAAAAGPAGSTGRPHRRPRAAHHLADEHRVRAARSPGVGQDASTCPPSSTRCTMTC